MIKRIKYLLCLSLCLLLPAACRAPITPVPEPVETAPAAETSQATGELVVTPTEEPSPPPEIPLYNDYMVTLEVDPETRIIKGIERIRYTNRSSGPLTEIVARVYLNAFSEAETVPPYFSGYESKIFKNGKDYGYMDILHVSLDNDELNYELDGTVLTILLDEPLQVEQTIQIKIQFDAYVPKIAHRTGANDTAMWCGMFLPVLSVYDGENWHKEPYYPAGDPFYLETANYTVEISTPVGYEIAGTGVKTEETLEDRKVTTFAAKMTRDFAFTVSSAYQVAERVTASGVNIQLYYYTKSLPVDEILNIAEKSMNYFEQTVGAYMYGQVCIAETDMFVNGMEFSKVVFVDSAYLQRTSTFASVVHELCHQWFFNVVGNNPIKEAWLDEGLTQFLQEGVFCETEEDLRGKIETDYNNLKSNHDKVTEPEKRVIAGDVSLYDNWTDYYQTQYVKARIMFYALRQTMGADLFDQFIKEYYRVYSFRVATSEDFIQKAEEVYGESLRDFFNEWLYSKELPELPA